ncbi:MAG: hypothetical protein KDC80_19055 [Saprospiraceae bacterium]|nr:hypothetical protein [Saprospiraceae bacterium]
MRILTLTILWISPLFGVIRGQSVCPYAENPVTLSNPVIVGNGTAASCTEAALQSALSSGGHVLCNCGPDPVTIQIGSTLNIANNTVLDGAGKVTLDAQGLNRIIDKSNGINLTVQRISFINGKAPGPNGHFTNECGGAILARGGGVFKAIECHFENNTVTSTNGSDIAGGGVYVFGESQGIFSACTFINNSASNGGAIGGLGSDIIIANCKFYRNAALGNAGGLRGHGGAINLDGVEIAAANKIYSVCGSEFIENNGQAQGGASNTVFSDNVGARLEMDQCYFEDNYLRAADAGNGGAVFHVVDDLDGGYSEMQFSVTRSTFYANHCNRQGGGLWATINGQGVIENCTFFRDSAVNPNHGLGGAASLLVRTDNQGGWTVRNNTVVNNYTGLFGGVFANPVAPTTWHNNLLFDNRTSGSNPWVGLNVNRTMDTQLGTNIQWPRYRPNNSEDTKATTASIFTDGQVETQLIYQGGPTPTLALAGSGQAMGTGSGCPSTDQRLAPRSSGCDLGAFEYNAMTVPSGVEITGYQLGHKNFIYTNTINSDAIILDGAGFTMEAGNETFLNPGFEVRLGAEVEIN